ncbi:MAG: polysaccharide biosynthesis tyrosine autokinase [Pseudomonadota bacterium]
MSGQTKSDYNHPVESILNDLDIKLIFYKLVENKWIIVLVTLIALAIGTLYTFNKVPKYVSTALIQVDSQLGSANNMQQLLGNMGISLSPLERASPAEIEIALIKSRFILKSVVDKLNLNVAVSPHYFPIIGRGWARHAHANVISKPPFGLSKFAWGGEEVTVDMFDLNSSLYDKNFRMQIDSSNTYSIYYGDTLLLKGRVRQTVQTAENIIPQIKIRIAEIKANPGTEFNIVKRNPDDVVLELAQGLSLVDLGDKIKAKTGVLQLTLQGNNPQILPVILNTIIDFAIQRNIEKKSAEASKTLDFLNIQLPEVKRNLDEVETALNEYRARSGTIDIAQEAKIILTQLSTVEQSIADLKLKRVELLQELTPQHPFIIALAQKQIQLQSEADSLETKIRTLPHSDQRAISLERTVKVKNQLYLLLLNSIQQLQVLKAGTLSDIRVLTGATTPIIPEPKHKSFTLLLSLILGLFFSTAFIFLKEFFHNTINNHELVEERLGIATFCILPYCRKQKELESRIRRRINPTEYSVLVHQAPKNMTSEAFRSLRTMLQFHFESAENNIICVLGATSSVGKSFTSVNLAHVLSEAGKRILLIDADMRKGKMNQQVGTRKSPGFAELLSGTQNVAKVTYKLRDNFDFIPSGEYPSHPSELLISEYSNQLITQLSQHYDYVIIDTPPILAVTDGIVIARRATTNLLVIGGGSNVVEEIEVTAKRAKKNGVQIHGLIFNQITPTKSNYSNYNYAYAYEE